jgi:hypothetical protein
MQFHILPLTDQKEWEVQVVVEKEEIVQEVEDLTLEVAVRPLQEEMTETQEMILR